MPPCLGVVSVGTVGAWAFPVVAGELSPASSAYQKRRSVKNKCRIRAVRYSHTRLGLVVVIAFGIKRALAVVEDGGNLELL